MASSHLHLDAVGIFWACLAATWTLALVAGIAFLLLKRDAQPLRIRGVPLSVCAVTLLHCYWISVQLGYIVRNVMPGDAEYWIMGTWLPLGIALFHASNSRFLHVARAQRRFMPQEGERQEPQKAAHGGLLARFRRMEHTNKVFTLVGAGMVFQILVTVLMYVISRKWHSSWGIPGTEVGGDTEAEQARNMNRGWEWAHSVFWQFFWAWIVAPVILWQSRGIHDTQGWRLQTIGCCIAGLPATPMWLIALYVPGMAPMNQYFIPPQWIAVSIMVLEVFTIFLPCWEVHRHEELQQETLDSIAQWEAKNQYPVERAKSMVSNSTAVDSVIAPGWRSSTNESILTMGALEHVLDRNPGPLLEFSVLRDFSGENIAFLTSVAEWKASFAPAPRMSMSREKSIEAVVMDEEVAAARAREKFNRALKIYVEYISFPRATFPVNLPSQILKQLEAAFEAPARELYGVGRKSDPAVPFEVPDSWTRSPSAAGHATTTKATTVTTAEDNSSEKSIMPTRETPPQSPKFDNGARIVYAGTIPDEFTDTIFDEAEASVKYLVLTNTWPKFVKQRRSSMDSAVVV